MKVLDKIKTHITLLVTFVFGNCAVYGIMWKYCIWYSWTGHGWQYDTVYGTAGQGTDGNMILYMVQLDRARMAI
jgi:hypothetical protein